ncbi:hypothetical protein [Syntrophomonas palmitatica]|uniref:hypothetical protein n=1 Tax=Syntrophomonas palmitatica TaxID=402877 RepID=UPI000ABADE6D|nr:hypothetical protein [Syntrophomonas palmitatica]
MLYLTVKEAAEKWGLGTRIVTLYCAENRIEGAVKRGNLWLIPEHAERPADKRRREQPAPQTSLSDDLAHLLAATAGAMPHDNPDAVLDTVNEERMRLQYEGEIAYLRGDFQATMACFQRTRGDDAARLRASPVTIAAAISLGDYTAYTEIEAYLKKCVEVHKGSITAAIAEHALATAAVSIIAPNMVPDWLKEGDFSPLAPQAKPNALYLRAKYFHCLNKYDAMLAVAQTALTLSAQPQGFTTTDIYLRVSCAVACHCLGRDDEARRWLLEAMRLALPHGFITPFAELVTALGGLIEQCLEREFPSCRDAILGQWERTWKNWIAFHNQFTQDNITLMLTLREYHLARLVAQRVPYAEIARQHCISVGRLKNIMLEIYEKLYISGREELAKYII